MSRNLDALPQWKILNELMVTSEPTPYKNYLKNPSDLTLRQPVPYQDLLINGQEQMRALVDAIGRDAWRGTTGKTMTDVVYIGMGDLDLGLRLSLDVLATIKNTKLGFYFISVADTIAFSKVLEALSPETTLFLVSSKSLLTEETLLNAQHACAWISYPKALKHHCTALTSQPERAQKMGYKNTLTVSEWFVGRYSSCSSMNLIFALIIGTEAFVMLKKGAQNIDEHFFNASVEENIPMLMALLVIWNILTHDDGTVDDIQQMDMGGNGKSVNQYEEAIAYATDPIVWGGLGHKAHHGYYQLFAQGHHQLDQSRIEILKEGVSSLVPHEYKTLGALISLYEDKVFTKAWLWSLNPFEKPGVESAKAYTQFLNPFRG